MGHDVIAGAEIYALHDGPQNRRRADNAAVEEIGVGQMPSARQMPGAAAVAHVFSGKLVAHPGVEHMPVAGELMLERLPIDQRQSPRREPATNRLPTSRRRPAVLIRATGLASRRSG